MFKDYSQPDLLIYKVKELKLKESWISLKWHLLHLLTGWRLGLPIVPLELWNPPKGCGGTICGLFWVLPGASNGHDGSGSSISQRQLLRCYCARLGADKATLSINAVTATSDKRSRSTDTSAGTCLKRLYRIHTCLVSRNTPDLRLWL